MNTASINEKWDTLARDGCQGSALANLTRLNLLTNECDGEGGSARPIDERH